MKLLRLAAVQSELQGNSAALDRCIVKALLIIFLRGHEMNYNCKSFISFLVICNTLRENNCAVFKYNASTYFQIYGNICISHL